MDESCVYVRYDRVNGLWRDLGSRMRVWNSSGDVTSEEVQLS